MFRAIVVCCVLLVLGSVSQSYLHVFFGAANHDYIPVWITGASVVAIIVLVPALLLKKFRGPS